MELSLGLALAAGLISFISPCVLPLVPAYITYMGGRVTYTVSTAQPQSQQGGFIVRLNTVIHSIFFVLGFSLVFVGIGLLSTAFIASIGGSNINAVTNIIGRAGGIIIIIFGLHFMGALGNILNVLRQHEQWFTPLTSVLITLVLGGLMFWAFDLPHLPLNGFADFIQRYWIGLVAFIPLLVYFGVGEAYTHPSTFWLHHLSALEVALYADTRSDLSTKKQGGFIGSSLMGIVFAAGWTPCIGPIYGAILTLAANGGSVSWAGALLLAYSIGLGIPFILTAGMLDSAKGLLKRLNRSMGTIKLVSGLFLIGVGILVATNQLQRISAWGSTGELGVISYNLEECFTQAVAGQIPFTQIMPCVSGEDDTPTPSVEASETVDEDGLFTIEEVAGQPDTLDSPSDTPIGIEIGNQVPNFQTFTETGETLELSSYRGQVIVLNFWATWCGPCRVEMPALEQAHITYADQGVAIIAVNNRETAQQMADFRAEMELTFPFAMDIQGRIQEQFGILNYPSTYIIGRDGIILDVHLGALTLEQIDDLIHDAL